MTDIFLSLEDYHLCSLHSPQLFNEELMSELDILSIQLFSNFEKEKDLISKLSNHQKGNNLLSKLIKRLPENDFIKFLTSFLIFEYLIFFF
jgi:hypothetical protein